MNNPKAKHMNKTEKKHTIKRNGRVYDRLDPAHHATIQIARSLSHDMPRDLWEVFDDSGELIYAIGPPEKMKD